MFLKTEEESMSEILCTFSLPFNNSKTKLRHLEALREIFITPESTACLYGAVSRYQIILRNVLKYKWYSPQSVLDELSLGSNRQSLPDGLHPLPLKTNSLIPCHLSGDDSFKHSIVCKHSREFDC